jgi:hypothetical protein
MRLIIIFLLSVFFLKTSGQNTVNFNDGKAWVIRQVKLRDAGGWHTVINVADIVDFESNNTLKIKELGHLGIKTHTYNIDDGKKLKISNGSIYHLKVASDTMMILTDRGNEFLYSPLVSTKNLLTVDSLAHYVLSASWSYDSIASEKWLSFSSDRFLLNEVDTGFMKLTETVRDIASDWGGWRIENYKETLLLTIFSGASYKKITYQIEEITDVRIKAIGWQDGQKVTVTVFKR